jgi:tetratricopeptide (TPR) repeat protein
MSETFNAASVQRLLQAGDAPEAVRQLDHWHTDNEPTSESLYLLAVSYRYAGDLPQALETIEQLRTLAPRFGRGFQEAGHIYLASRNQQQALSAFQRAVALNDSLLGSWRAIIKLCARPEHSQLRKQALLQSEKLAALPPALLSVRNAIAEANLRKAEDICRHFLKQNPTHVEAMRLLADLGVRSEVLDDAEFLLESALEFEPDNRFARYDYMNVLYRRQKYAQAMDEAKHLLALEPNNAQYQTGYANQCVAIGDFDEALDVYDQVLGRFPETAQLHLLRGHALKTVGRTDEAITAYRKTYATNPRCGDAYWSLANLKTFRFSSEEVMAMSNQEASDELEIEDQVHFCFALGKHFEDNKDYATSFDYYNRGNELRRKQLGFSADLLSSRLALQSEVMSPEFFARHAGSGCQDPDPIFIVGLPRAGSTLLEQILASHSQVDGTQELPNIGALAYQLDGRRAISDQPRYPHCLEDIDASELQKFGEQFLADTRIHRRGAPFFIDKMPNNFRHIGLIQLILPNAKIIDARREPLSCCFSGFKQLFSSGQEFTYGLEQIGQYYNDYLDLMEHWDRVLPGKILRVQHEDVVADLEGQVRRLLDYCGLSFEQACVDFHNTERSVRTPSSEQVRQPIFTTSLEAHKPFEPWLGPLQQILAQRGAKA